MNEWVLGTGKVILTREYRSTRNEICLGSEAQILWLLILNLPRPSIAHMEEFQRNGVHINEDFEFTLKISFLSFSSKVEKNSNFMKPSITPGKLGPYQRKFIFLLCWRFNFFLFLSYKLRELCLCENICHFSAILCYQFASVTAYACLWIRESHVSTRRPCFTVVCFTPFCCFTPY